MTKPMKPTSSARRLQVALRRILFAAHGYDGPDDFSALIALRGAIERACYSVGVERDGPGYGPVPERYKRRAASPDAHDALNAESALKCDDRMAPALQQRIDRDLGRTNPDAWPSPSDVGSPALSQAHDEASAALRSRLRDHAEAHPLTPAEPYDDRDQT